MEINSSKERFGGEQPSVAKVCSHFDSPTGKMMPKSRSKVLALVTDAFGTDGGIAQYNRDLLTAFAECDEIGEVIILPRVKPNGVEPLPSRLRQLKAVPGRIAYSIVAFARARSLGPIGIVFCGHIYMLPLAVLISRSAGAQLWVQIHGIEAWREMSRLYQRSLRGACLVTCVSRYTRAKFLQWTDVDPSLVKVLPNTVSSHFRVGTKRADLVEKYGLAGKEVMITVSRLASSERYKGHELVFAALTTLLVERPNIIYLIVGDGDDRGRLQNLCIEFGISGNVRFVGRVPSEELPDYFQLADLFVMPSTGEGFGIVYLEALASGIAVIAGNRDGSRDPLCDGEFGTLIDPANAQALIVAIRRALANKSRPKPIARFQKVKFEKHVRALVGSVVAAAVPTGRT